MGWKEAAIAEAIRVEEAEKAERLRLQKEAEDRLWGCAFDAANEVGFPLPPEDTQVLDNGLKMRWEIDGVVACFHASCSKALTIYHDAFATGNRQVRDKRQLGDALRDIAKWEKKQEEKK